MADDLGYTPGTGATVATDDVGGVHYQKVKLDIGGNGVSVPVEDKLPVGGDVAHDAADSGNPVKIGGKANSSVPATVTIGDRVDAWFGLHGEQIVAAGGVGATTNDSMGNFGVGLRDQTGSTGALYVIPRLWNDDDLQFTRARQAPVADTQGSAGLAAASLMGFNGTTWDRVRTANTGRLQVDVVSVTAGDNNIGNVDVVSMPKSATATLSAVNDTNVSTTLLASNANRLGATIWNDSTAVLYVKFGTTASATSCTVKMIADAYYEVPFGYTGRIDGIWASDASGAARITELS